MINPIELSTDKQYFADKKYMSVSAWKKLNRCEIDGCTEFKEITDALLIGSYVDAHMSGTLEQFKLDFPQIFTTKISENENTVAMLKQRCEGYVTRNDTLNSTKLADAKKLFPECFTVVTDLKANYKNADEICKFIDNDKTLQKFLSGDKQSIFTGEVEGVPFKSKLDSYSEGKAIVDLKCMATITSRNGEYYDFITAWDYDVQVSLYQEMVFQNTGEKLPCFIAVVTKETPINSAIIQIPQEVMDKALYRVQENIKHLYDVKMGVISAVGCGKCKSCIASRSGTPLISMYDFLDYMGN
jgi:hypothetical protein